MRDCDDNEAIITAFGKWVEMQPKGVLTAAMRATGLAWSTVCNACKKRMQPDVARALSKFTRGAVPVADIERSKPQRARHARRRA